MTIKRMTEQDREGVMQMMQAFYSSPAVYTNGSKEIFENDIRACLEENPYLEGYVLEEGGVLQGYAMLAKSFSTEFGKPCIWIEDLYVREGRRGLGYGGEFLQFVSEQYPNAVLRLEVEEENERAARVYQKEGFSSLPYKEMIKLR